MKDSSPPFSPTQLLTENLFTPFLFTPFSAYRRARALTPSQVACYVHYPILTPEMSSRVAARSAAHNNAPAVARSPLLTRLKLGYYFGLTAAYGLAGRRADVVLANGRWTAGHLRQLWGRDEKDRGPSAPQNSPAPSAPQNSPTPSAPQNSPAATGDGSRAPAVFSGAAVDGKAPLGVPRRRAAAATNTGGWSSSPRRDGAGLSVAGPSGGILTTPAGSPGGIDTAPAAPPGGIHIVYPPCDTRALERLPLWPRLAAPAIVLSISQFRPEKDQPLQLRAFARVLRAAGGRGQEQGGGQGWGVQGGGEGLGGGQGGSSPPMAGVAHAPRLLLVLAGAVRHDGDAARLRQLQTLAADLGLRSTTLEPARLASWLDALELPQSSGLDSTARPGPAPEIAAPEIAAPGLSAPEADTQATPAPRAAWSDPGSVLPTLNPGAAPVSLDVVFAPNLDRGGLMRLLSLASVGLHTMWNEHFGIGVVELMAAGVPTVAHKSGGPLLDIVCPEGEVGLLATTEEEYADAMAELLLRGREGEARRRRMGQRARQAVAGRFSEQAFAAGWCAAIRPLLQQSIEGEDQEDRGTCT